MDKNTTIAFVLIGAILIIWLFLNTPEQEKQTPGTIDTTKVIDQKPEELPKTQSEEKTRQRQQNTTVEDSSLGRFSNAFTDTGRIITVETDLAIYEISTRGANFHKIYLKKFNNWYSTEDNSNNFYKKSVQLINYSLENAYNISFVSTEGKAINTSTLNFKTTSQSKLTVSGNDSLIINFRMELNASGAIEKNTYLMLVVI
ncbi:MAG: hypothetical protein M5T52_17255 [Ignavibacteriaceae bacterium]|nr:hypothetical protein [Ignavibacteriaceae bacterium]